MIDAAEPFAWPARRGWIPPEMLHAPSLDAAAPTVPLQPRYALLVNPFYPKDPHASFGKHVLTPTLALTSFAATTPASWQVRYWDENLRDGRPPHEPMPEVVGITVHLTFARWALEIADWYRSRGIQLWPRMIADLEKRQLKPRYMATYENQYRDDPVPRRAILQRASFLTTTSLIATRGCHNRCGFCYLATEGLRMPYRMKDPAQIAAEFNLGSRLECLAALCEALRPLEKIWSAAVSIDVTDDPRLIRAMALAGCTRHVSHLHSVSCDSTIPSNGGFRQTLAKLDAPGMPQGNVVTAGV